MAYLSQTRMSRDLLRITNIAIDLTLNDDANAHRLLVPVDIRHMAFMVDAEDTTSMKMRRRTSTQWVPENPTNIDFSSRADSVTVVLQDAEEKDFGFIFLPQVELYMFLLQCMALGSEGKQAWFRVVETEELPDGCSLTVSWDMEVSPSEKNVAEQESTSNPADPITEFQRRLNEILVHTSNFTNKGKTDEIIEDWIAYLRRLMGLPLPGNHPQVSAIFSEFCFALKYHFQSTGDLSSIDEAIFLMNSIIPDPSCLTQLANMFEDRYSKSGEVSDVYQEIGYRRRPSNSHFKTTGQLHWHRRSSIFPIHYTGAL